MNTMPAPSSTHRALDGVMGCSDVRQVESARSGGAEAFLLGQADGIVQPSWQCFDVAVGDLLSVASELRTHPELDHRVEEFVVGYVVVPANERDELPHVRRMRLQADPGLHFEPNVGDDVGGDQFVAALDVVDARGQYLQGVCEIGVGFGCHGGISLEDEVDEVPVPSRLLQSSRGDLPARVRAGLRERAGAGSDGGIAGVSSLIFCVEMASWMASNLCQHFFCEFGVRLKNFSFWINELLTKRSELRYASLHVERNSRVTFSLSAQELAR